MRQIRGVNEHALDVALTSGYSGQAVLHKERVSPANRLARRAERPPPAGTSAPGDRDKPAEDRLTPACRLAMPPACPGGRGRITRKLRPLRCLPPQRSPAPGGRGQLARAVS